MLPSVLSSLSHLTSLVLAASPEPAPDAGEWPRLRLAAAVGGVLETRGWADDQVMLTVSALPTLRLGHVVVGLEADLHTTGHNDEKLDLGGRAGAIFDVNDDADLALTIDFGWRQQTKSRFVADTILGDFDDEGVTLEHAYVGASVGLTHRDTDGGFVYGLEAFTRLDTRAATPVLDEEGDTHTYGGTVELGLRFTVGFDAILGQ